MIFEKLYSLCKKILSGVGKKPELNIQHKIGDYRLGGLRDVDIPSKIFSLKFSWIKSLKDKKNFHPWKQVATQLLSSVGGESVFHSNLKLSPQYSCNVKKLSSFYKGLVYAWEILCIDRKINLNNKEMILSQSLWNNSFIFTADSKTLFNLSLFKK